MKPSLTECISLLSFYVEQQKNILQQARKKPVARLVLLQLLFQKKLLYKKEVSD
jgi:hypothetical protein